MFGAKLSWCQIIRCQIVLVPNYPGGKLSTFIILVPNCLFFLSWCQIVRFIILVPNCPTIHAMFHFIQTIVRKRVLLKWRSFPGLSYGRKAPFSNVVCSNGHGRRGSLALMVWGQFFQNLNQTSPSRLNLKFKIFTKPIIKISTQVQFHNLCKTSAAQ